MSDKEDPAFELPTPESAARYAIEASGRIAAIMVTRVMPGMMNLGVYRRQMPGRNASDAAWSHYFRTLDKLESTVLDGLRETSELRLRVAAVTLPHVAAAFYEQPGVDVHGDEPWQLAGRSVEKAAVHDAIEVLAAVGLHWGNGFLNPGLEI